MPKYKSTGEKSEYCLYSPTVRSFFQSGAEKPFKMASLISYIVEGLFLFSSSAPVTEVKKLACCHRLATTTDFLGEGGNNLPSPISYIVEASFRKCLKTPFIVNITGQYN